MAEGSIGYLFDENFSPKIVRVLRILGETGIDTVVSKFGSGAKDPDWLPCAAAYGYICVTLDRNQLSDQHVAKVFFEAHARAIFLSARYSHTNQPLGSGAVAAQALAPHKSGNHEPGKRRSTVRSLERHSNSTTTASASGRKTDTSPFSAKCA